MKRCKNKNALFCTQVIILTLTLKRAETQKNAQNYVFHIWRKERKKENIHMKCLTQCPIIPLHCTVLYCTVLYCTVLYCVLVLGTQRIINISASSSNTNLSPARPCPLSYLQLQQIVKHKDQTFRHSCSTSGGANRFFTAQRNTETTMNQLNSGSCVFI